VSLAIQRTSEFAHKQEDRHGVDARRSRVSAGSSWRGLKVISAITFVACPKVRSYQVLVLGDGTGPGLVWPEGKPEDAAYRCAGVASLIPHHEKAHGWSSTASIARQNPSSPIPGFRVSQLISPKRSWGSIAVEFLAGEEITGNAQGVHKHRARRTVGGEARDPMDERALWNRCEPFEAEAPEGAALITAGVDVQADRLEVELVGWGRDEESWSIAYSCDPRRHHAQRGLGPPGGTAHLRVPACVRSGNARGLRSRSIADSRMRRCCGSLAIGMGVRVYAVKGRPGQTPIWPRKPSRKNQTPFFMVGVDAAKTAVYDRLRSRSGTGILPFSPLGRELEYFEQLTRRRNSPAITTASRSRNGRRLPARGTKRWIVGCTPTRRCMRCTRAGCDSVSTATALRKWRGGRRAGVENYAAAEQRTQHHRKLPPALYRKDDSRAMGPTEELGSDAPHRQKNGIQT